MSDFEISKLRNRGEVKWYISNGSDLYLRHDLTKHGFMNSDFVYGDYEYSISSGGGTYYKTFEEAEELLSRYKNGKQKYKLGKWYNWTGGECPVHPKTKVEAVIIENGEMESIYELANFLDWDETSIPIVAFKVVEKYQEPQEFWIHKINGSFTSEKPHSAVLDHYTHFREVKE